MTGTELASPEDAYSASAAAGLVLEEISDLSATLPDDSRSADEDAV